MQIGQLRNRALLQRREEIDVNGDITVVYVGFAALWVGISSGSSREFWEAKKIQPKISHELTCRYTTAMKENMRLVCGTQVFQILGFVDTDNTRRWLRVFCEELVQRA